MTAEELKTAKELQAQINLALVTLQALPVGSWGPLIDTEKRLTQADKYITQFIALCEKRAAENISKLCPGDKVKIVNCAEAELYEGQTFEVLSAPWEICGTMCVKIERKGAFDMACLEKVGVQ